jgi:D-xylose transport system substrate-binding protein
MKLRIAFVFVSLALSIILGLVLAKEQIEPLNAKVAALTQEREKLAADLKSEQDTTGKLRTQLKAATAKAATEPEKIQELKKMVVEKTQEAAQVADTTLFIKMAPTGKAKPRIGLSLDTLKEERWQRDRDTFVARAQALGAEVIVLSANSDDVQQVKDCNSLLAQNIDVLVIAPHNGEAMSRAVEEAHASKVVVCAYDRLIKNCDLDFYFTFDNVKVGELQGRFLMEKLFPSGAQKDGPKKRIARIYGAPTDNNAKLFQQGQNIALKPFEESGQLEIVFEDWAEDWKPENGKKIAQAAITKAGAAGLDAILASNDGTAGGAIQALLEDKLVGKVLVTGQDADLEACRRILRDEQTMTIYKPLKLLAEKAAEVSVELAKKQPVKLTGATPNGKLDVPTLQVDVVAVHKGNIRETVVKDGFHAETDIFSTEK